MWICISFAELFIKEYSLSENLQMEHNVFQSKMFGFFYFKLFSLSTFSLILFKINTQCHFKRDEFKHCILLLSKQDTVSLNWVFNFLRQIPPTTVQYLPRFYLFTSNYLPLIIYQWCVNVMWFSTKKLSVYFISMTERPGCCHCYQKPFYSDC